MKLPFINPARWADLIANFEQIQKAIGRTTARMQASGPWQTGIPPDATTGFILNVSERGQHILEVGVEAWATAIGQVTIMAYLDGNLVASKPFFFNTTGEHHFTGIMLSQPLDLTAGKHYLWIRHIAGTGTPTSDLNDSMHALLVPA